MNPWIFLLLPLLFLLVPSLHAQEVSISGNGEAQAVECDGGDAVVRGNDNQLAMHGDCRSLLLEGNNNRLRAQLAPDAQVQVRGNGNDVLYQVSHRGVAHVQVAGRGDTVRSALASPVSATAPSESMVLREENMHRDMDCNGRDVLIEGNGNEYTLRGGCRSLTMRGEGLMVRVEMQPGGRIALQGNGNTVTWTLSAGDAEPVVSINGEGSRVAKADAAPQTSYSKPHRFSSQLIAVPPAPALPVPATTPDQPPVPLTILPPSAPLPARSMVSTHAIPPSGPLILHGDHEARDVDCTDRDVKVEGSYGIFVLRGACRSVSVKGDSDKVQAEIAAGSHLTVNGTATTVAYVLIGGDAEPVISVTGDGSRAWPIPRLGEIGLSLDTGEHPPAAGEHAPADGKGNQINPPAAPASHSEN